MPHICRAVRGPTPVPGQLQIYALSDRRMPGGNRGRAGGGEAQVGGAFTLDATQVATGGGGGWGGDRCAVRGDRNFGLQVVIL
jgi:hypothetical protein